MANVFQRSINNNRDGNNNEGNNNNNNGGARIMNQSAKTLANLVENQQTRQQSFVGK